MPIHSSHLGSSRGPSVMSGLARATRGPCCRPTADGENIQINDLAAARATALLIGIPSEFSSLGQGHVERGLGENAVDLETEEGSRS